MPILLIAGDKVTEFVSANAFGPFRKRRRKFVFAFFRSIMKLGFIGIIIEGDRNIASSVQAILSEYADLIVGRMGLPSLANNVCMITVGVKGPQEKISALSGRLGRLKGVKVKSAVSDIEVE